MSDTYSISIVRGEVGAVARRIAEAVRSLGNRYRVRELTEHELGRTPPGDLVLLMSGADTRYEVLANLRATYPHVGVVLLVAAGAEELLEEALRHGAEDVLDCSDSLVVIARTIARVLLRREQLARLHDEEQRWLAEQLLECQAVARVGYWEMLLPSREVRRSPEWCRITGVPTTAPALSVNEYCNLLVPGDRERVLSELLSLFQRGLPLDSQHRLLHSDGSTRFVHARARGQRDDSGAVIRVFGTLHDITELRTLQGRLEEFAHSVAHEVRGPVNVMTGFASLIADDAEGNRAPLLKRYAAHIVETGQRLNRVVASFLDLSRSIQAEIKRTPVDLSALAARVVGELQARGLGANIVLDIKPGLHARGDAVLLDVLLSNLLGNALKYSAMVVQPRVQVGVLTAGGESTYFVSDNGVGFDETLASCLFQPFSRLHQASAIDGIGLGLTICERIVKRHGGTIRAESRPGHGTTLFFTLGECFSDV